MPIITRSVHTQRSAPEAPAPAETQPEPTTKKRANPPAQTFDESTSRGWLDRVAHQFGEFSAIALNPETSRFDLPTTEHNLDCLIREIDKKDVDETVKREVREMRKKINKVITDMAPRLWWKVR